MKTLTEKRIRKSKLRRQRDDLLIVCAQALKDCDRLGAIADTTRIAMQVAVRTASGNRV